MFTFMTIKKDTAAMERYQKKKETFFPLFI